MIGLLLMAALSTAASPSQPDDRIVQPAAPTARRQAGLAEPPDAMSRVARANAQARVAPRLGAYANARQVYVFSDAALYQVFASPGRITDIALQPGERLVDTGAIAAGDTARWVIGDTESGSGAERRVHILVKPTQRDLATNLVINTDRRTYHLELRATPRIHMAAIAWRYPLDEARAAAAAAAVRAAEAERASAQPPPPARLNFAYRIEGRASWRPTRVYDDGRQTVIEFPPTVAQGEMPPLFVGDGELVNYRVHGQRMIVDRIFEYAQLKLGAPKRPQIVRLRRLAERGT